MSKKVAATVRVQVTLEITPSGGGWGQECKLDQVYKQAKETAMTDLGWLLRIAEQGFQVKGDCGIIRRCKAKVVGKPRVLAIVAEEKER